MFADIKNDELTNIFTSYIKSGTKNHDTKALGVELEHFILDTNTLLSTPYSGESGVKEILKKLMAFYPDATAIFGEDILGFLTKDFTVTLEPAAQIEISIRASDDIALIKKIYAGFYENISKILAPLGKELVTLGCQPVSLVDDLELIPKGRYRLMDEHFKKTGTGGRQMMRGTASTQVSIDYTSEEDFRRKLQAAYLFTPLFKLISDRVKSFQGEPVKERLKRTDIWNRTDPARCGILPGIFKPDYGFSDYAKYVANVPLILKPSVIGEEYVGFKTATELYEPENITITDIEHIFSMPFPDVRVKKYIEIRGADAMPVEEVLAYCALIKGLLYSENVLDFASDFIKEKELCEDDIRKTEKNLTEYGWEGFIYGISARDFLDDTLERCKKNLSGEELGFLALTSFGSK